MLASGSRSGDAQIRPATRRCPIASDAPNISADESLSPSEEEQLFHHYGMDGHDGETTILVVWVATG